MADTPTLPDNYVELRKQNKISHYEQKVWPEYGKLSFEMWGVVFDMKKNLVTILNSPEVKEEPKTKIEELKTEVSGELVWEEKERFIQKLKNLPDYEWSKVKEAVEKWTIEIKKIPWIDGYAIYESKVWNLIYITYLDWEQYANIYKLFNNKDFLWDSMFWWYIKQGFSVKRKKDFWEIYDKNWIKILKHSNQYSIITLNAVNYIKEVINDINNIK